MTPMNTVLDRRSLLAAGAGIAGGAVLATGDAAAAAAARPAPAGGRFPKGFLWGAASAGYQTEGNNVAADLWVVETMKPSPFPQKSGDACDSYHRWQEDIDLLRGTGLNAFRFSIEWSRIEPEEGQFSIAELDHYRRILEACHKAGVTPNVTLNHFASPRWFAARGAWNKPDAPDLFARYADRVGRHMGDLIGMAVPFNEPNAPLVVKWSPDMMAATGQPMDVASMAAPLMKIAAKKVGSDEFSSFLFSDPAIAVPAMIRAHDLARAALKAGPGDYPVGAIVSIGDDQAVDGGEDKVAQKRREVYGQWLEVAGRSDFLGVQAYTRYLIGPNGPRKPAAGSPLTKTKWEYYPAALGHVVSYAASQVKVPIYITENGISTDDDRQRIAYTRDALAGLKAAIDAGADVRGYFHWTLLDNWEWNEGYKQNFGLFSVDRSTFKRTSKPSAAFLGGIARRNAL
ncbi:family 1 glycosylhydrolase [Sphingomonas sp. RP10(2022)]|uniref:beta-glucosidase n=1 Tax=Sphingomonas liriopis TaxID=2949094 RepID=A0A9X2HWW7_9SPHN|nr:family 1 glycosylhydrolase [Sphingomonas liriopis]MCP3733530.1 family 1 glycosylhydrolase [Sphingomonas liriopis]